jgi:cytochrome c biogenesis protein CcmG, thiol:disulfide interchange protein DsbE
VKRLVLFALPLVALVGLIVVFATNINRDPNYIPSVLINKPAPAISLAEVPGLGVPGFDSAALKGEVTLVNIFASWCVPCRDEHPMLLALSRTAGVRIFGINQKDAPDNAVAFLSELGNPYVAVGADSNGRASIDWGVYGVPETFLVDRQGVIVLKIVGPLTPQSVETTLLPAIEKARSS